MAATTVNMGLVTWNELTDYFNHSELQGNFEAIDEHDHTTGKGVQLPEGALAPDSVTSDNLKDNSVTGNKLVNGSVTSAKLAASIITGANVQDDSITASKLANDAVGAEELSAAAIEDLGLSEVSTVRRGSVIRAGSDSVTNTSFTYMTNADSIASVYVPTGGLLHVAYHATWKKDVAATIASAAVYLGAAQLRTSAVPTVLVQAATIDDDDAATAAQWRVLRTTPYGLESLDSNTDYTGDSVTGQIIPTLSAWVAGNTTYTVGVKFKATGSGTVTTQARRLYVWTTGF